MVLVTSSTGRQHELPLLAKYSQRVQHMNEDLDQEVAELPPIQSLNDFEIESYGHYIDCIEREVDCNFSETEIPAVLKAAIYFEDDITTADLADLLNTDYPDLLTDELVESLPYEIYNDVIKGYTKAMLVDVNRAAVMKFKGEWDHVFVSRASEFVYRARAEALANHKDQTLEAGKNRPVEYEILDGDGNIIDRYVFDGKDKPVGSFLCFAETQVNAEGQAPLKHFCSAYMIRVMAHFDLTRPYHALGSSSLNTTLDLADEYKFLLRVYTNVDTDKNVLGYEELQALLPESEKRGYRYSSQYSAPSQLTNWLFEGINSTIFIDPLGMVETIDDFVSENWYWEYRRIVYRAGPYSIFGTDSGRPLMATKSDFSETGQNYRLLQEGSFDNASQYYGYVEADNGAEKKVYLAAETKAKFTVGESKSLEQEWGAGRVGMKRVVPYIDIYDASALESVTEDTDNAKPIAGIEVPAEFLQELAKATIYGDNDYISVGFHSVLYPLDKRIAVIGIDNIETTDSVPVWILSRDDFFLHGPDPVNYPHRPDDFWTVQRQTDYDDPTQISAWYKRYTEAVSKRR